MQLHQLRCMHNCTFMHGVSTATVNTKHNDKTHARITGQQIQSIYEVKMCAPAFELRCQQCTTYQHPRG